MTDKLAHALLKDSEYEEVTLASVRKSGNGYELKRADGWMMYIDDPGFEPKAGQTARYYGKGIGYPVRGVVIGGKVAFYRTADEERRKHEDEIAVSVREKQSKAKRERAKNDKRIADLPDVFQRRIARFRAGNPDFEWDFQPYELFTCEEAVKIAKAFRTRPEDLPDFHKLTYTQQKLIVPGLSNDHSGNTFGCAVLLARWYLLNPEMVVKEHGAMVPLVGCKAYGCTHDR